MPSGGSVRSAFFSFVFYFPTFLPVGRRSRALFSLLPAREREREREIKRKRRKEETAADRSVRKVLAARKISRAKEPTESARVRKYSARFCVNTREVACL